MGVEILHEDGRTRSGDGARRAAGNRRGGDGLRQYHQSRCGHRGRRGDGLARRSRAERHGVPAVPSHRALPRGRAAIPALRGIARRGRAAAQLTRASALCPRYHELAELAPRDVVARAIHRELEMSTAAEPMVYLDVTHLDGEKLKAALPDDLPDLPEIRAGHYARPDSDSSGGALRDGRGAHRPGWAGFAAGTLCRGRSGLHRGSRSQSAGEQFPAGRVGVWRARSDAAWPGKAQPVRLDTRRDSCDGSHRSGNGDGNKRRCGWRRSS